MEGFGPLGDFLRARRRLTSIEQVGLRAGGQRRTPGLRREEVAMLAGVSIDYYTRLEQGRERRPSDQVVGALARALCLDSDAVDHLYELARPRSARTADDRVDARVRRLMECWTMAPAYVVNRRLDVLATNRLGAALIDGLKHPGNLLRLTFLDPASRDFYLDWEQEARYKVAYVRAAMGSDVDDPALVELVRELSAASEDFRVMWARHDVWPKSRACERMYRPEVGEMVLHLDAFAVNGAPGQELVVFQAEPGSPSERALIELAHLSAARHTRSA
ncbi:helix-turn-helix transcriptional regulator [Microbispora corallina]|nr:helix-turn-helix transcriptional regulator [Microbispora corallina]